ncbi:MAG: hypothetical protein KGL39_03485 [Patescibacteria group bacterium]|nr:hypothetical protein [Patescibacteria group bacterium]
MAFSDWKGTAFEPYLLPIIPAGSKINHAISKLSDDKVGKLPGKWVDNNGWVGFPKWQEHRATGKELDWWERWYFDQPCATIGMRTGDYLFVDIDVTDAEVAEKIQAAMLVMLGPAPIRTRPNSAKRGMLYQLDTKRALSRIRKSRFVFNYLFEEHAVEILGDGEQFVCEGMHPSGVLHRWNEPVQTTPLTAITGGDIDEAMSMVREIVLEAGYEIKHASAADKRYDSANARLIGEGDAAPSLEQLAAVLKLIPCDLPEFAGYQEWFVTLCAIKQACAGDPLFYHEHVMPWAGAVPANLETIDEQGTTYLDTKWDSIAATEVGFPHLEHLAHNYGYTGDAQREFEPVEDDSGQPDAPSGPPLQPDLQTRVAKAFVEKHARRNRLVVAGRARGQGEWYAFKDGLWRPHLTPLYDVQVVCEDVADPISRLPGAVNATRTRVLHSEHTQAAIERMLRQRPELVIERQQLDSGDLIFGVPEGYVDADGALREPDPALLITMSTRCAPAAADNCPLFKKRLLELFSGDKDQFECFRLFCGYMMTGRGNEQKFLFIHGAQGGEGKSTILQIIADVLGAYATTVPYEAFVVNKHNRFAFADITKRRMIFASEVNRAEMWNDTLLKDMTGSVPIITEQKFVAQTTTEPTWGLIFSGNNMPRFQTADPALHRRMVTLRVYREIAASAVDLKFRMRAVTEEGPGILRWLIKARQEYLSIGHLVIPDSVQAVTDEFFRDQDKFGLWLEDCVEFERGAVTPMDELRASFNLWGELNEAQTWTSTRFATTIKSRSEVRKKGVAFDRLRLGGSRPHCAVGLRLKSSSEDTVTKDQ